MSGDIEAYCEDATNSWDGYIYQGKVAIYIALREINEAIELDDRGRLEKTAIEIEWVEDFSIVVIEDEKINYQSIHQVKARADKTVTAYGDALTKLYKKTAILGEVKKAYLHVSSGNLCKQEEWDNKVCLILKEGKELKKDIEALQQYYEKSSTDKKKEIEKLGKPGRNTRENRLLKEYNERSVNNEKITIDNIDILIKGLITELEKELRNNANNISTESIDKMELYKYEDGRGYCAVDEIDELIKEQIERYWRNRGDSSRKLNDGELISLVAMSLSLVIDKHVIFRHKNYNNTVNKVIFLTEIEDKLNDDRMTLRSEEFYLYHLKNSLLTHCEEYQQECYEDSEVDELEEKCKYCELEQFKNNVISMGEKEIKQLLIRIYLDVSKEFDAVGHMDYSNDYRIKNSVFIGLRDIAKEYEKDCQGISYVDQNKNRNLLTALFKSSGSKNPEKSICKKLVRNSNIQELMMDYEVIISKDIKSKSILDDAGDIYEKHRYEENHILYFKDTEIKPLKNIIKDLER